MTNKVRILGIDSYMDTNMMSLSSEKLDSEFLYNIISKEGLYKIADTSTIPQINNKHIEPYEVIIPSLDEQKRIGVYFRSLDHLITLHQRKPIPHPNHPTIHTKHKGEEKYVRIRVNDRGKIDRTANLRRFPVDIPGRFKN